MKLTLLYLLLTGSCVLAQLAPGELHQAHAALEGLKNCAKCHDARQQVSASKCLDCHTVLAERITAQKGLHAQKEHGRCEQCHVEHQGRTFTLIYWKEGKERFDHRLTGYELAGKHATLACTSCHQQKNITDQKRLLDAKIDLNRTHLGLQPVCLSCHRDEHRGGLSGECLRCHTMAGWKPAAEFDHNRTHYPLTGKHATVACLRCHPAVKDNLYAADPDYTKYSGIEYARCTSCHKDIHEGRQGENCEKCHTPAAWKTVPAGLFNHDQSRFPLRGRHAALTCQQCHRPGEPVRTGKFARCLDCHEDYHAGQLMPDRKREECDSCHDENSFSPAKYSLDQHQKTAYPLAGAHLAVPCNECHPKIYAGTKQEGVRFRFASTRCPECHQDVHRGEVKKYLDQNGCEFCHGTESWSKVTFDHRQTRFPLEGKHSRSECRECHKPFPGSSSRGHLQFAGTPLQCAGCHEDIHNGQFQLAAAGSGQKSTSCDKCHGTADWKAGRFDHNRDSSYKLEGAHVNIPCQKCHPWVTIGERSFTLYKPLPKTCESCHGANRNQPSAVNK